jgi:uncharacterized protein
MRRFIAFLLLAIGIYGYAMAKPYTIEEVPNVQLANRHCYTSNPDGILSAEAVRAIDAACDSLRTKGVAQVAVVAIKDIASDDVFTFAHKLFSSWGVGSSKSDNGLGIILVLDKREIRFVTGYGIEGILPDAICKRIQQRYMVGPLGNGDYDKGMIDGITAISALLSSGELPNHPDEEMSSEELFAIVTTIFSSLAIFLLIIFLVYRAAHRCPKCGKHHLKQINTQILQNTRSYQIIEKHFVCPDCGNEVTTQSRIDKTPTIIVGGGGHRGGGGFGGGFGGGSFGGGGAGSRF